MQRQVKDKISYIVFIMAGLIYVLGAAFISDKLYGFPTLSYTITLTAILVGFLIFISIIVKLLEKFFKL
jgi:VIT1/CCC1 family predicted Fe2+/Mn2+ transporter